MIKDQKGETLIEIVIAIGILAVVCLTLLKVFAVTQAENNSIQNTLNASYVCQNEMEFLFANSSEGTETEKKYFEVFKAIKNRSNVTDFTNVVSTGADDSGYITDTDGTKYYYEFQRNSEGNFVESFSFTYKYENITDGTVFDVSVIFTSLNKDNLRKVYIEVSKDADKANMETYLSWKRT